MKILITGSSGFLGKKIVEHLAGYKVFELNRKVGDFHFDLNDSVPAFTTSFDLVIHNAGKAHVVPMNNEQNLEYFGVNVNGVKNLLQSLEAFLPQQFVFISSVSVYGLDQGKFIDENYKLLAKDPYGLSKKQAEDIIQEWCLKYNVVCTILRLPLVVGHNPPGNLGNMINAIQKGYYFNIAGGKAKKSMVLAEDITKVILTVSKIGGIFNLTDGHHPSYCELSENIASQLGKSKPISIPIWLAYCFSTLGDILGDRAPFNRKKLKKMTSDLTFDDTKARKAFGWNPTPVLEGFVLKRNK
jgi:nucleoside-diphosphate-sugar epimerase